MIFDGKLLSEISDDEILSLVKDHIAERQNIEYKVSIDHKSDDDRFETLCDITSLANAGGGYLIVGIRDDGKGRAQKFESVFEPDRIIKSIQSLCLDFVSERIEGLEIDRRNVSDNDIILIRVPASSRIPHMVSYKNKTHFVTRYIDGKREMTIGEIRSAFSDNSFARRLSGIEDGIKSLMANKTEEKRIEIISALEKGKLADLEISDGKVLSEGRTRRFLTEIGEKAYFRVSVTPAKTHRNLLDVDSKPVMDLVQNPPFQRPTGWNMEHVFSSTSRFSEGLIRGNSESGKLTLLQNGHMEFSIPLDFSFSWTQPESEYRKHPLLYPYAVVEYPVSFLRVYKHLAEITSIETTFVVTMQYFNINGYILRPYGPKAIGFIMPMISPKPYADKHFSAPIFEVEHTFNPDKICYELLKALYASFGYSPDKIPFYNKEIEKFDLG